MKDCTYYDLLGVSADATDEELSAAKTFLLKKFHPDANMNAKFDCTGYVQKILDAYNLLTDPKRRRAYDTHLENIANDTELRRNSKTKRRGTPTPDFAPYWEAANKLNDLVQKCAEMIEDANNKKSGKKAGKKSLAVRLPRRKEKEFPQELKDRLANIANIAKEYTKILEDGGIPKDYWYPHAMNWLLFQWTQNRTTPYEMLFGLYEGYVNQLKIGTDKKKVTTAASEFAKNLDALLSYQSEDSKPESV